MKGMSRHLHLTLRQLFALSLLGLTLGLALLFYLFLQGSQRTLLQSAERFRDSASLEVRNRVIDYLNEAPSAVTDFAEHVQRGLVNPANYESIQSGLLSLLLANQNISEATFTTARSTGFDDDDNIVLENKSAGQVIVLRDAAGGLWIKHTWFDGKQFVSESHMLDRTTPAQTQGKILPAVDPTDHPTFRTPASKTFYGQLLRTDLAWSQAGDALPEYSVLKTIADTRGNFAGVLRIGLSKDQIDRAAMVKLTEAGEMDQHLVFLCDKQGRLITGFNKNDKVVESGDDLRLAAVNPPPQVVAALRLPALQTVGPQHPSQATSFVLAGKTYLGTFRALPDTQDWIVGIVVPRDFYLAQLMRTQRRVLWAGMGLIAIILLAGALMLRNIGRAHSLIVNETARMKAFDFTPSSHSSGLQDIEDVLDGLEKAKTAMRAMGKYVPVDLVRRLYRDGKEPVLGAELVELSILFTDIKEFTPFAEQTEPRRLATVLGRYLQVMAGVIQSEKGTVDKYIGDAVMAIWNAPEPVAAHAVRACRAALGCRNALRELYQSPEWAGEPKFETRFGLHYCTASVGHFGAPDRFNYTAIGDGINLASRLEGLNKYYGTSILVSESVYANASGQFEFRLLDRVAVKGKTQGITIYELLDYKTSGVRADHVVRYEQAFQSYLRGDFGKALSLLSDETHDAPSAVLAERCRHYLENPCEGQWTGVHSFETK